MTGAIRIRDEILEVLYWLRGEGIHEEVRPGDLRPFVQLDPDDTRRHLEALAASGILERRVEEAAAAGSSAPGSRHAHPSAGACYRLTERGLQEAARRFVEAFAPMLGQGHGSACAPDCECRDPAHPDVDCPTHGSRAHEPPS